MALSTADDYKAFLNAYLYQVDKTQGGIEKYAAPVFAQILPEDYKTVLSSYYAYKTAREGQIGVDVPYYRDKATNVPTFPPFATTQANGGIPEIR